MRVTAMREAVLVHRQDDLPAVSSYLHIISSPPASQGSSFNTLSSSTSSSASSSNKSPFSNQSEELQHVSDLSGEIDDRQSSTPSDDHEHRLDNVSGHSRTSTIKVEITDLWGDESINFTTSTLKVCKERVLRPYWGLLTFIAWRGLGKESMNSHLTRWRVLNVVYTTLIILLLFYTYMYEVLACEWKLDINAAWIVKPTTTVPPTRNATNNTKVNISDLTLSNFLSLTNTSRAGLADLNPGCNQGCNHIVTTYLIPNFLHLLAYSIGLFYFRLQENEQLYALMEKVFLQATTTHARTASQHKMIIKLRVMLLFGSFWVVLTVFIQCLYVWAFDFPEMPLFSQIGRQGYYIMLAIALVGRAVFNSVILAIVMNYVTQCEMIKFYVQGLTTRLQEKSTDLKTAMKDMLTIRQSIGMLNGIISRMTSLVTFIVAELSIIGFCVALMNDIDDPKVWAYRILFPFSWGVVMVVPLWQAARVNSMMLRIQKISLEMRVFGYKKAGMFDLDSFLSFVTLMRPKAKLCHMPIQPAYLIFAVVTGALIFILLIQSGRIGLIDYIF